MALTPINEDHALQIQAGTLGRKAGHAFEDYIAHAINHLRYPITFPRNLNNHVMVGDPSVNLLHYVASTLKNLSIDHAAAISTGALATTEEGTKWLRVNGVLLNRCKSDIIINLRFRHDRQHTIGISIKQCNNRVPTNAQLYFTTALGFSSLLVSNGIPVSNDAIRALREFCGDRGFRPCDSPHVYDSRVVDPRRFFWEETSELGHDELESIFSEYQDVITRLLLQKAYLNDPFKPDYLLHKTKHASSLTDVEVAIYQIDELVSHSQNHSGFLLRPYSIRKGSYRDPKGVTHLAPRFGVVQMQRGGQKQHPEQLQFNLAAGYFYKIDQRRPNV